MLRPLRKTNRKRAGEKIDWLYYCLRGGAGKKDLRMKNLCQN